MRYTIQTVDEDDYEFLTLLNYIATFPSRTLLPISLIRRLPEIVPWTYSWGRPSDCAVVAVADGIRLGAAWYRLFTQKEKAPGFLDERIPVMAMAVLVEYRQCGIGGALLEALKQQAREAQYSMLSLGVARANERAVRLYERHHFELVRSDSHLFIMQTRL